MIYEVIMFSKEAGGSFGCFKDLGFARQRGMEKVRWSSYTGFYITDGYQNLLLETHNIKPEDFPELMRQMDALKTIYNEEPVNEEPVIELTRFDLMILD